jgi:hypothetical protein
MTDHLIAKVTGEHELTRAVNIFRQGLGRCRDKGYEKFIVDYQSTSPTLFATESIIYSMEVMNLYRNYVTGTNPRLRVAYLMLPEHLLGFDFDTALTGNSGLTIEVFESESKVNNWLNVNACADQSNIDYRSGRDHDVPARQ